MNIYCVLFSLGEKNGGDAGKECEKGKKKVFYSFPFRLGFSSTLKFFQGRASRAFNLLINF